MSVFFICLLFSLLLSGWALFFTKAFNTELRYGYFNATAFCSLASFFGFLLAIPQWSAVCLLGGGGFLFAVFLIQYCKKNKALLIHWKWTLMCFSSLALLFFLIAYGIKFRSIDDYSFWGVVSKYLFVFNSLPQNSDYISGNYLTYTPVLASFHYLLYTLGQHYSVLLGYFAQDVVLISAMITLFNEQNKTRSLLLLALWYLLLSLAYGMPSLRMEVDAYVASYFFAVSWLIYSQRERAFPLIIMPILLLSVIKEIGFLFALCCCLLFLVVNGMKRKNSLKIASVALGVLGIKAAWKMHVMHMGFKSFSNAISLDNALSALNPFNEYYHHTQWLYLKSSLFAGFDRSINTPYCLIYVLMGIIVYSLVKNYPEKKKDVLKTMSVFAGFALLYWLMIYLLQAIVFQVGHGMPVILDFQRYFNMLFLPWLALAVFVYLDIKNPPAFANLSKAPAVALLSVVFVFLIVGTIERSHKFYNPNDLYEVRNQVEQQREVLNKTEWALCLVNPPTPTYQLGMPLTYFFMPQRVYYPATEQQLALCDVTLRWDDERLVRV